VSAGKQGKNSGALPPGFVAKQFKPGQSGNPKGRPRGTGLTDKLRAVVEGETQDGKPIAEALMRAGVAAAMRGDFRFWKEILDRIDGPVVQKFKGELGADAADISDEDLANLAALAAKFESEKTERESCDADQ
jgi:hypothetical protein